VNGELLAGQALDVALERFEFQTVLDIGSGQGLHAARFRAAGKRVVTLDASDHWGRPDVLGRLEDFDAVERFDLIWASHVLEHQVNPGAFLAKARALIAPGGFFAITVPPAKDQIVGGHVTIWNEGLLVYNLILAGFDCANVSVKRYGYNITAMGRAVTADLPRLTQDCGDIELLARFFPWPVAQGFNGCAPAVNWPPRPAALATRA